MIRTRAWRTGRYCDRFFREHVCHFGIDLQVRMYIHSIEYVFGDLVYWGSIILSNRVDVQASFVD